MAARLELWHTVNARSFRCLWTMEELGLKNYKLMTMPFPPRVFHKPFLKTNVLGTIPYFVDHDKELNMTESCSICLYLVDTFAPTSLRVSPEELDYGNYLNWVVHSEATLTFPQTVVLRYTLQEVGRADAAAKDYAKWYIARLRRLDNVLKDGRKFLCANRFTIADICVTYALTLGTTLFVDDAPLSDRYQPQTLKYMQSHVERAAYHSAQEKQETSAAEFEAAL